MVFSFENMSFVFKKKNCSALLTLATLMDEEASNRTCELIRARIWIAAIRANSDYWQKVAQNDDSRYPTVYGELLDRITACGMYYLLMIIIISLTFDI